MFKVAVASALCAGLIAYAICVTIQALTGDNNWLYIPVTIVWLGVVLSVGLTALGFTVERRGEDYYYQEYMRRRRRREAK